MLRLFVLLCLILTIKKAYPIAIDWTQPSKVVCLWRLKNF